MLAASPVASSARVQLDGWISSSVASSMLLIWSLPSSVFRFQVKDTKSRQYDSSSNNSSAAPVLWLRSASSNCASHASAMPFAVSGMSPLSIADDESFPGSVTAARMVTRITSKCRGGLQPGHTGHAPFLCGFRADRFDGELGVDACGTRWHPIPGSVSPLPWNTPGRSAARRRPRWPARRIRRSQRRCLSRGDAPSLWASIPSSTVRCICMRFLKPVLWAPTTVWHPWFRLCPSCSPMSPPPAATC